MVLPWTLGWLRDACKLNLSVEWPNDVDKPYLVSDVARAMMQASHELTRLETLVRLSDLRPVRSCERALSHKFCNALGQSLGQWVWTATRSP